MPSPYINGYTISDLYDEIKSARRWITSGSRGRVYFDPPRFDATSTGYLRMTLDYKVAIDNGDLVSGSHTVAL